MFNRHKQKTGIRLLKMLIERDSGEIFNLKRITRIKKKYKLVTQKRRRKKIRQAYQESVIHKAAPNILEQCFKVDKARAVFSTDVTYLINRHGNRAYLSAVKDLATNEIVGHEVSFRNDLNLVMKSIENALKGVKKKGLIIHSDQGFQYTHEVYRNRLKRGGITQSMSRRGNCLDNAPIESFFGHMKDELDYKNINNIDKLKDEVARYMDYYNKKRPQWSLKRKTPVEYRSLLK
jgi:putative transposase